jgi:alanine racemase
MRAAGRRVWAVIKANAYGHGIESAVRGFAAADGLALLDFDEASRARAAGWHRPILMLEGCFDSTDIESCRELDLTTIVHDESQLRMLELAPAGHPIGVHLKVNTGMNRLGFDPAELPAAVARLARCAAARVEVVSMHFANADRVDRGAGPVSLDEQLARFDAACRGVALPRSLSNSAALFLHPPLEEAWVRPGIALYGATPDAGHTARELGLRPAMRLMSELLAVRTIAANAAVGYGSRFTATQPTRIGVVACGYADGYPRHAADGTPVAVAGRVVPMIGRVSMDMITVDLSSVPDAVVGSPVELWGDVVPIDDVAERCGTVGYELMCAVARRVRFEEVG